MNAILFNSNNPSVQATQMLKEAEQIIKNSSPKENKPKSKKSIIIIICLIVFVILLTLFSTIFAILNMNSNKIISGISILGIDVSNLTKDEAKEKVSSLLNERLNTNLVFSNNEQIFNALPAELGCSYNIDDSISKAYSIGRTGHIFKNNFDILTSLLQKKNINPEFLYSLDSLNAITDQINATLDGRLTEASYAIEGNNLIITAGKSGYVVKKEELKNLIIDKMTANAFSTDAIPLPLDTKDAEPINIEKIHSEIYKEPKDAYYTQNPFAVFSSETGLDFNISMDEAKNIAANSVDTCTIPLKTLYPKVTTDDLGMEAFPDLLASYSTNYSTSSANRSTNIALAASKINGTVLMPGEVFSFNGTVGKRTPQAGFKIAGVYANGTTSSDYGGGICQVSSTLYNAVLKANLDIVNRVNHMFTVGYVPIGLDATVSWGAPDFKFKNSRKYPIKLVAKTSNKKLYISVYGCKEDVEYDVELISYKTGTVKYSTVYTTDSSLAKGKTKVVQAGSNGSTSVAYKVLKLNGKEVSRTLLSKDTYSPHNQIIARGTK